MKPIARLGFLVWGSASLLVCACGPIEPVGTPGALKEGGFTYCDGVAQSCAGATAIPDHLAVGSTFTFQFSDSFGNGDLTLSSSDTSRLQKIATNSDGSISLRALAAGAAQVEARTTMKSELIDFVRLDLQDIDSLKPTVCPRAFNTIPPSGAVFDPADCGGDSQGSSTVEISLGSSLAPTVCARPTGATGDDLDGSLTFEWAVNDGGTAELELFVGTDGVENQPKNHGRCATIGGLTVGTASVTVSAVNATGDITVTVNK
jgi:hypothetical protein